jgi:hypothetical protein
MISHFVNPRADQVRLPCRDSGAYVYLPIGNVWSSTPIASINKTQQDPSRAVVRLGNIPPVKLSAKANALTGIGI